MSPEDRRLSPFRVFTRPDVDGNIRLPLTVDLFFGLLKLERYVDGFKANGCVEPPPPCSYTYVFVYTHSGYSS
jgi:hypothetical protein